MAGPYAGVYAYGEIEGEWPFYPDNTWTIDWTLYGGLSAGCGVKGNIFSVKLFDWGEPELLKLRWKLKKGRIVLNQPPTISSLTANPTTVSTGAVSTITCTASDPDVDTLSYTWTATGGTISGSGSQVSWTAPVTSGTYTITCTVSDGKGGSDTKNVNIMVTVAGGGVKLWTRQLGTATTDYGCRVATDSSGNIYVTGSTYGGLDGNTNAGSWDIFLIKYGY